MGDGSDVKIEVGHGCVITLRGGKITTMHDWPCSPAQLAPSWRLVSRPDTATAEEAPDVSSPEEARARIADAGRHVAALTSPKGFAPRLKSGMAVAEYYEAIGHLDLPQPRHNTRCQRGHRAYVGLFAVQCETCERIAEVEREEPEYVGRWWGKRGELVWRASTDASYAHPLREGAVAMWRAARIAELDAEGRR